MTEADPGVDPPDLASAPGRADPPEPSAEPGPAPTARRGGGASALIWLLLLGGLAAAGYLAWQQWLGVQRQHAEVALSSAEDWRRAASEAQERAEALAGRTAALAAELEQVRERQRNIEQRLSDLGGSTRVLREEVLGVGERAAALEDGLARIARSRREGTQTLQLDEIEFLLQLAGERLALFGDIDAAERALLLAAGSLDAIGDPIYAGLRQTLAQELAALRALPADDRPLLRAEIADLQRLLPTLPTLGSVPAADDAEPSRLRALLDSLVTIRRVDDAGTALSPLEVAARSSALLLQLSVAQAALERGDQAGWTLALDNALALFDRLFEPSIEAVAHARLRLRALRDTDISPPAVTLGAALQELRNLRATRQFGRGQADAAPRDERAPPDPSRLPLEAPDAAAPIEPALEADDAAGEPLPALEADDGASAAEAPAEADAGRATLPR